MNPNREKEKVMEEKSSVDLGNQESGFKPNEYEIEVLSRHYWREVAEIALFMEQTGQSEMKAYNFALRRLHEVSAWLAPERAEEILNEERAKWDKHLAKLEEARQNLPRCGRCGADRRDEFPYHLHPDGHCYECAKACPVCSRIKVFAWDGAGKVVALSWKAEEGEE
jgi:hypothetical protein